MGSVAVIKLSKEKKSNMGKKRLFHPRTPRSESIPEGTWRKIHVKDLEAGTKEEARKMLLIDLLPGLLSDFSYTVWAGPTYRELDPHQYFGLVLSCFD